MLRYFCYYCVSFWQAVSVWAAYGKVITLKEVCILKKAKVAVSISLVCLVSLMAGFYIWAQGQGSYIDNGQRITVSYHSTLL